VENRDSGEENRGGNSLDNRQPTVVIRKRKDLDQNLMK
jgi:hypothetical protein